MDGGETFQIPFPRADSGFVEIIDIEHQTGGRGAENAEIASCMVLRCINPILRPETTAIAIAIVIIPIPPI